MVYLRQIQELVEKNEKIIKEQEQVKVGMIKQILKLQSILGYGRTHDPKKNGLKQPTTPTVKATAGDI